MEQTPSSGRYRVEAYLRKDTFGTYRPQQAVLGRLSELESEDVVDSVGRDEWDGIQTMEYESRKGALATYEEFRDWARHNDARLEPAFNQRILSGINRTKASEVVVFPVISLAVYDDQKLQAVFPNTKGQEHFTVNDCLTAFESGNAARFFERFKPRTVDRTMPYIEDSFVSSA